jgi:hypothetical protein
MPYLLIFLEPFMRNQKSFLPSRVVGGQYITKRSGSIVNIGDFDALVDTTLCNEMSAVRY